MVLKNNGVKPASTGADHFLELMPGYIYCFLPSLQPHKGEIRVYTIMPKFISNFEFCFDIEKVVYNSWFLKNFDIVIVGDFCW